MVYSITGLASATNGATQIVPINFQGTLADLNAVSVNSIATVATPTSGKTLQLLGGTLSVSADASVLFEDNAQGAFVFRTPLLLAKTPYTFMCNKILGAADNVLKGTGSTNAAITGVLYVASI